MSERVFPQDRLLLETFIAQFTLERSLVGMYGHMLGDALFRTKRLIADTAFIVLDVGMDVEVVGEIAFRGESLLAQITLEFLVILLVALDVCLEIARELKLLIADVAGEVLTQGLLLVALAMVFYRLVVVEDQVANITGPNYKNVKINYVDIKKEQCFYTWVGASSQYAPSVRNKTSCFHSTRNSPIASARYVCFCERCTPRCSSSFLRTAGT